MSKKKRNKTIRRKLRFVFGNNKLSRNIATFSLPAGHSCPFALDCLSKANRLTGKVTDGKDTKFRCFAAMAEAAFTSVRKLRWQNLELLRKAGNIEKMTELIQTSIPFGTTIIRIHASGDFYTERYFLAWLNVAYNYPAIVFYGYTKAVSYLVKYKDIIPSNFRITASKGGKHDHLIKEHNLKYAEVVFSKEQADAMGLELDDDDSHAIKFTKSFALLLHGTQPEGSIAASALSTLRKQGHTGYGDDYHSNKATFTLPVIHFTLDKENNLINITKPLITNVSA